MAFVAALEQWYVLMLLFVIMLVLDIMHVFMHVLALCNLAADLVVHRIPVNSSSGTMATCTTS